MTLVPVRNDALRLTHEDIANAFLVGYGQNTRTAYQRNLRKYFSFCSDLSLDPRDADRTTRDGIFQRLLSESRGLSAASCAQSLSAISGFYKWAVDEGLLDRTVSAVRRPRVGS